MMCCKKITFTFLFSLMMGGVIQGQPSQVITPIEESARQLFDIGQQDLTCNGKEYRLYIAQPVNDGRTSDSSRHSRPVLYMLDGNGQFPMLVNAAEKVSDNTPLIVGIGYPSDRAYPKERTRDYTIPVEGNDEGGGAEDFYRFIVDKVRPFVETNYAVDTARQTLCGHSHGGLFTLYVMFNHTEAFHHYVAASPSLWWGDGAVIPGQKPLFTALPRSVTITLGEYEEKPESDPSRKKLTSEILKIKEQRKGGMSPRDLAAMIAEEVPDCRFILFEGKNHGSSIPGFLLEAASVAGE